MSQLSSSSTLAEIRAAYDDNASYAEDGSLAKARAFITACRLLLHRLPRRVAKGRAQGEEVELDLRLLQDQIVDAQRWLSQAAATVMPPTYFSIEHYRD